MNAMKKALEGKSYPIDEILPEIKETVLACPSVVLQAPPGSGKTTRTPLALLEVMPTERGRILMLEPRRIAAVSAARWMARLPLHPRLGRLSQRAAELGCPRLGANLAAILSERDILRGSASGFMAHWEGSDLGGRLDLLRRWRKRKEAPGGTDPWALRAVDRASHQLQRLTAGGDSRACSE